MPLGSTHIRENLQDEKARSILLYGPKGCGKTSLVQAIANEVNAVVINLSPSRLNGKSVDKNTSTKIVHMAFSVAKDQMFSPVIIYFDESELFFESKN